MNNPFNRAKLTAKYRLMVISAKGGVGKSTLTVNLAAALAARGKKVGIFDADVHGPNIPALLGVTQTRKLRASLHPDAMIPIEARPDSPDMRPLKPLTRYGMQIMSLALLVGEGQTLNPLPDVIGKLVTYLLTRVDWGNADVLLLDMPPGTGEPLNTIIQSGLADGVVLITVREKLAHLDNGRLVSLLRSARVPVLGVVENMTHIICPRCGELIEMYPALTADQPVYEGVPVLGAIPFHPDLIRARRNGAPLPLAEPQSPVSLALFDVADKLIELIGKP